MGGGGGGGGRARESEGSTVDTARKNPERAVDRRQYNGSVKAVSPPHCAATSALRSCCFNCRAETSERLGRALMGFFECMHTILTELNFTFIHTR